MKFPTRRFFYLLLAFPVGKMLLALFSQEVLHNLLVSSIDRLITASAHNLEIMTFFADLRVSPKVRPQLKLFLALGASPQSISPFL